MFYLLLFLQHLMRNLMRSGLLIHIVGMDLINALDFDSLKPTDEWQVVVKGKEKPRVILKMLA